MNNRIPLTIYVVPSGVELYELADYTPSEVGKFISSKTELKVNKVDGGYSVIFEGDGFKVISPNYLITNIINIFKNNLPNVVPDIRIDYLYDSDDDSDYDWFDEEVGAAVLRLDIAFHDMLKTLGKRNLIKFFYRRSESVKDTAELYAEIMDDQDEDDEEDTITADDIFGDMDEDEDDDGDDDSPIASLNKLLRKSVRAYDDYDDEDDEDEDYHHGHHRRYSGGYDISRILTSAKNPKRSYNRHGVIIARRKKDIRHDEKIIYEFLEEFIPGEASWKKHLRRDLVKRWLHVYAVTTKQIKKLERQHREMVADKYKLSIDTDRAIDFTRRMFTTTVDNWDNPNK